jgi:hypothetical protein
MRASTLEGMGKISATAWDALTGAGRARFRHAFLFACEAITLPNLVSAPLALFSDSGDLLAHAPAYCYDLDLTLMAPEPVTAAVQLARRAFPHFLSSRVLEVGCPQGLDNPFSFAEGVDRTCATEALLREALTAGRGLSAKLTVVQAFTEDDAAVAQVLRRLGFEPVPLYPRFVLRIKHRTFDEHLQAMRKPYRQRAKRWMKGAPPGFEVLLSFEAWAPQIASLSEAMAARAREYRRETLDSEFFLRLARMPGTKARLLRRPDGSLKFFSLELEDGPSLRPLYIGFEREDASLEGVYFRAYYEVVRRGIDAGFQEIDFGITTGTAKMSIGAKAVHAKAWIRHENKALHRALVWLMNGALAPPRPAELHVFRDGR